MGVFRLRSCAGAAFVALAVAVAAIGRPAAQAPAATPGARVSFNHQIRPLLSDRCFRCHGPDERRARRSCASTRREGALEQLEDGWAVVKPGDPGKSELVGESSHDDPDEMMPPPESHLTLSARTKALLVRWIDEGAEYEPHWALRPGAGGRRRWLPDGATGQPDRRVRARAAGPARSLTPGAAGRRPRCCSAGSRST